MANEKRLIAFDPITFESFTRHATKHREPYDHYDMGYVDAVDQIEDWLDANTVDALEVDTVIEMFEYMLGDCPCNFSPVDEWLGERCELQDECPYPKDKRGCWKQFIKHFVAEMDGDGNG